MFAIFHCWQTLMDLATLSPAACIGARSAALLLTLVAAVASAGTQERGAIRSGTLVFPVAEGEPVQIPRLRSDVKVEVNGIVARIELTQRFRNPSAQWAEGIYAFPVPANAGVERISAVQDGKLISDVRRTVHPQQLYDAARSGLQRLSAKSGARSQAASLLRAPIPDIAPHATLEITISYLQVLDHGLDRQRLRIPLGANRGPIPDLSVENGVLEAPASGSGWLQMSNASAQRSSETTQAVDVRVSIDAGFPIAGVSSRYHAIQVLSGERSTITSSSERASAEHDFELEWEPDARQLSRMPLARAPAEDTRLLAISVKLNPVLNP
jgi:Ca-activated chloride channel family protein